jgi:hypothetical protein
LRQCSDPTLFAGPSRAGEPQSILLMITISITHEATLPKGAKAEARPDGKGGLLITLDRRLIERLSSLRGPGESYSDAILRLAEEDGSENSRLKPRLATIVDARGIRPLRTVGKRAEEIGEFCVSAFGDEPRHSIASTPAARLADQVQERRLEVTVRVMAPSRGMA